MKPSASSGTWELKLPRDLHSSGVYTLKIFNEQQNGVGCSDYASPFSVISLTLCPAFREADFTLPADTAVIEAGAFDGDKLITAVDARNCSSIGKDAFRGCTALTQILVDAECEIDEDAFSGCGTIRVYADGFGKAKTFCDTHDGFVFVKAG